MNTDRLEMKSATVADIAVSFPQAIGLLNRYHLDYCCNGGRHFTTACNNLNLDAASVWDEILETSQISEADARMRFEEWKTPFLIDYIVQNHHSYVKTASTRLLTLLGKVEAAHGDVSPEVVQVRQAFEQLAEELLDHMTKEELIVFPAVRRLTEAPNSGTLASDIAAPLACMEDEHEEAGVLIRQIRSLTEDYTPPPHACTTFQIAWKLLKEFDDDLMQHIHLENNILFPRVKMHR